MIDIAIQGDKHDYGHTFDEKKTMEKIKKDCLERLEDTKISEEDIFLISNHHPEMWYFDRLKTAIFDRLPAKMKEAFIFSLRSSSKDILCAKVKVLGGMCGIFKSPAHSNLLSVQFFSQLLTLAFILHSRNRNLNRQA